MRHMRMHMQTAALCRHTPSYGKDRNNKRQSFTKADFFIFFHLPGGSSWDSADSTHHPFPTIYNMRLQSVYGQRPLTKNTLCLFRYGHMHNYSQSHYQTTPNHCVERDKPNRSHVERIRTHFEKLTEIPVTQRLESRKAIGNHFPVHRKARSGTSQEPFWKSGTPIWWHKTLLPDITKRLSGK